ncbi:Short-chain dehydrogenase [Kaistia soli DSM 19436]|uniref:Short-chain dehydrogenase n=1 Tax=Kaistia soli DSM 19436 TaxID=1122133 RepID=A0A1M5DXZ8_9HYPH|nr:Short-chain dehydrogenase [Kaistia soli DSM 19436]
MERKQSALVTGASSGMGKIIAKQLLQDGYDVIVAARRVENMQDLKALGAHPVALDVSDEASITAAYAQIEAQFGGVDVLVNNAGFGLYGAVEDVPLSEVRYQFEVNLFGMGRLIQLFTPYMRRQKAGKIVNIASMGGKIYTPLGAWYHATKHAVEGLSDSLRLELSPFGIDVIVIEPGIILTDFGAVLDGPLQKFSGKGAYADLAAKVARGTADTYAKGNGSSPQVVADAVSQALKARRPRTRYAVGRYARMLMGIRKWLGDRMYDRVIMATVR